MSPLRSFASIAIISGILTIAPAVSTAQPAQANRTPVLVELFTSEGCSSCPPADALLAKLDQEQPVPGADIIVLGEHVDYWDGQGWHDRFSSHQYTDRQADYVARLHVKEGSYTPQMIVDGTDQFVGNDASHALQAIQHAAQSPRIELTLSHPVVDGRKVSATVSASNLPAKPQADLYAALVDPTDTTDVRGGENGGHHLQHAGVVRKLQRVGSLKDLAAKPVSFSLSAPSDAKPGEMRLVVFLQQSGPGEVLGAASAPITPSHHQIESIGIPNLP
jgi:hypothetical protein